MRELSEKEKTILAKIQSSGEIDMSTVTDPSIIGALGHLLEYGVKVEKRQNPKGRFIVYKPVEATSP